MLDAFPISLGCNTAAKTYRPPLTSSANCGNHKRQLCEWPEPTFSPCRQSLRLPLL